jgi:PhnB protein
LAGRRNPVATKKAARKRTAKSATRKTTKAARTAKKAPKRAAEPKLAAVTPYLAIAGASRAIAWYKTVFGAKQVGEFMPGPDGTVMHAMLEIGGSHVFLSDIFPGADVQDPARVGASVTLHYYRPNAGHVWERALANGAKVTMPFEDQFWGDVYGKLVDPFGHSWAISRKSKLSKRELDALRAKAMKEWGA